MPTDTSAKPAKKAAISSRKTSRLTPRERRKDNNNNSNSTASVSAHPNARAVSHMSRSLQSTSSTVRTPRTPREAVAAVTLPVTDLPDLADVLVTTENDVPTASTTFLVGVSNANSVSSSPAVGVPPNEMDNLLNGIGSVSTSMDVHADTHAHVPATSQKERLDVALVDRPTFTRSFATVLDYDGDGVASTDDICTFLWCHHDRVWSFTHLNGDGHDAVSHQTASTVTRTDVESLASLLLGTAAVVNSGKHLSFFDHSLPPFALSPSPTLSAEVLSEAYGGAGSASSLVVPPFLTSSSLFSLFQEVRIVYQLQVTCLGGIKQQDFPADVLPKLRKLQLLYGFCSTLLEAYALVCECPLCCRGDEVYSAGETSLCGSAAASTCMNRTTTTSDTSASYRRYGPCSQYSSNRLLTTSLQRSPSTSTMTHGAWSLAEVLAGFCDIFVPPRESTSEPFEPVANQMLRHCFSQSPPSHVAGAASGPDSALVSPLHLHACFCADGAMARASCDGAVSSLAVDASTAAGFRAARQRAARFYHLLVVQFFLFFFAFDAFYDLSGVKWSGSVIWTAALVITAWMLSGLCETYVMDSLMYLGQLLLGVSTTTKSSVALEADTELQAGLQHLLRAWRQLRAKLEERRLITFTAALVGIAPLAYRIAVVATWHRLLLPLCVMYLGSIVSKRALCAAERIQVATLSAEVAKRLLQRFAQTVYRVADDSRSGSSSSCVFSLSRPAFDALQCIRATLITGKTSTSCPALFQFFLSLDTLVTSALVTLSSDGSQRCLSASSAHSFDVSHIWTLLGTGGSTNSLEDITDTQDGNAAADSTCGEHLPLHAPSVALLSAHRERMLIWCCALFAAVLHVESERRVSVGTPLRRKDVMREAISRVAPLLDATLPSHARSGNAWSDIFCTLRRTYRSIVRHDTINCSSAANVLISVMEAV